MAKYFIGKYFGVIAYFSMLLLNIFVCALAIKNGWDLGATTFYALFIFIAFFILLERLFTYKENWHTKSKEWKRDSTYLLLVIVFGALGGVLVRYVALLYAQPIGFTALWSEIIIALLIASFGGYWFHRVSHANKYLWQFHGIHHLPHKVNLTNNSVVHFFDVIGGAIVSDLPLLMLGFSENAIFIVGMFKTMQGYFIHTNINIMLGAMNYVVASPECHRLHHSVDVKEAGNYSSDIMLWDILFGSYTWRSGRVPVEVGIKEESMFPSPFLIGKSMIHPFMYWYRSIFRLDNRVGQK